MTKIKCEFCGKTRETESTIFVGQYCIACHQALIQESKEAIEIIKERKKVDRIDK